MASKKLEADIIPLRHGGKMCLMGGGAQDVVFPNGEFVRKDLTIKGKWMYEPVNVTRSIGLVNMGTVKLDKKSEAVKPYGASVSARFKLAEWEKAFDKAERVGNAGNVVFEPCVWLADRMLVSRPW